MNEPWEHPDPDWLDDSLRGCRGIMLWSLFSFVCFLGVVLWLILR